MSQMLLLSPSKSLKKLRLSSANIHKFPFREVSQIKFLLGHTAIQTTELYLGSEQEIGVNDNLGL
jgi:hypothetical protein